MATGFIQNESGFTLVAILGLEQGTNLYVDKDNRWLNRYLPIAFKTFPFFLLPIEDVKDELAFCVDLDSGLITDGPSGEEFFGPDGELTPHLQKLVDVLRDNRLRVDATNKCCKAIAEFELIKPWHIVTGTGDDQVNIEGLYCVDEKALLELSDDAFLKLRHAGALPMIYCQLLSMRNIDGLKLLFQESKNPDAENLKELDFSLEEDNGNLQFDL